MEFSGSGLTAWYGTPDAPAPPEGGTVAAPVEVTVGVSPAMASNAVTVLYRENGAIPLAARATLTRTDPAAKKQYFRAVLPVFSPGVKIEYQPMLFSAGRQLTTATPFPSAFYLSADRPSVSALPVADPLRVGGQPYRYRMEHLTRMAIQLQSQLEVIGNTPEGLRVDFLMGGGSLKGEKLNGIFHASGGDWMRIRTDGIGLTDILTTIQTDDGALLLMEASGIVDLGADGFDLAMRGKFRVRSQVVVTPLFLTSDSRYLWLNRVQCIGIGYVNTEALHVHYDIYAIYSESDTTDGE